MDTFGDLHQPFGFDSAVVTPTMDLNVTHSPLEGVDFPNVAGS